MDCDIIIPVWNQLECTKNCINSILEKTDVRYKLIIVDNASNKDTADYLNDLKEIKEPEIVVVRNENNVGFVKAVNQGIQLSRSPYLCILNNDTLVAKGWLGAMIKVASGDKHIGIVNPASNNLGQMPFKDESIEMLASRLRQEHDGDHLELGSAIGFCMLIKREVIDKIGMFDEVYGMGNYEDTDFCRRAVREGYKCVMAWGAYVYHIMSTSFLKLPSFNDDYRRNREIYEFRWGKPKRYAYVLDSKDSNVLKKLEIMSLAAARGGNWASYISKDNIDIPKHSNIIAMRLDKKYFYLRALWAILKKKKKFDEISVTNDRFGSLLEAFSFIHSAKVNYL